MRIRAYGSYLMTKNRILIPLMDRASATSCAGWCDFEWTKLLRLL
jgi:hypothetical protein